MKNLWTRFKLWRQQGKQKVTREKLDRRLSALEFLQCFLDGLFAFEIIFSEEIDNEVPVYPDKILNETDFYENWNHLDEDGRRVTIEYLSQRLKIAPMDVNRSAHVDLDKRDVVMQINISEFMVREAIRHDIDPRSIFIVFNHSILSFNFKYGLEKSLDAGYDQKIGQIRDEVTGYWFSREDRKTAV